MVCLHIIICFVFFFNDTATTEIYTLSLHDALPISERDAPYEIGPFSYVGSPMTFGPYDFAVRIMANVDDVYFEEHRQHQGRSEEHTSELQSPVPISYAVFCLKKKKKKIKKKTSKKQYKSINR